MRVQTREVVCAVRAIPASTVSIVPAELIYADGIAAGESDGSSWAGAFNRLHNAPAAARTLSKPLEIHIQGTSQEARENEESLTCCCGNDILINGFRRGC
jgi:hypothetical protein